VNMMNQQSFRANQLDLLSNDIDGPVNLEMLVVFLALLGLLSFVVWYGVTAVIRSDEQKTSQLISWDEEGTCVVGRAG